MQFSKTKAPNKEAANSYVEHLVSVMQNSFDVESATKPTMFSEGKLDRIVQKVEQLDDMLQQLSDSYSTPASQNLLGPSPFGLSQSTSPCSIQPSPSCSSVSGFNGEKGPDDTLIPEYEGESSLFAHAVYATRFLQSAVSNSPPSKVSQEMNSVLDALWKAAEAQKQQTDTLENLYPNARPLPPGADLRNLPMPDINKALACLRMAQGKQNTAQEHE